MTKLMKITGQQISQAVNQITHREHAGVFYKLFAKWQARSEVKKVNHE